MLHRFESLASSFKEADGEGLSVLRYRSMGLRELEQSTIEVRRRGRVGLRERLRVSTDTGASAGLTARIVASTNLICLLGELVGDVESSFLPQRPDVTLEGELDCQAPEGSMSKPSLSSSYEQQAV